MHLASRNKSIFLVNHDLKLAANPEAAAAGLTTQPHGPRTSVLALGSGLVRCVLGRVSDGQCEEITFSACEASPKLILSLTLTTTCATSLAWTPEPGSSQVFQTLSESLLLGACRGVCLL